jgi:Icc-related predicted phosphoesterase
MRLWLFSDVHCDAAAARRIVERSREADVMVGAGDFATMRKGLGPIIEILRRASIPAVLVPGNSESADELRDACHDWPAAHVLHGSKTTIDGLEFFGLGGGVPPTPFGEWSFDLREADAAQQLAGCPDHGVLVTHSPPRGYLDVDSKGRHLGSTAIRAAIELHQPLLAVCGHIHASAGRHGLLNGTPVVNAGPEGILWNLRSSERENREG